MQTTTRKPSQTTSPTQGSPKPSPPHTPRSTESRKRIRKGAQVALNPPPALYPGLLQGSMLQLEGSSHPGPPWSDTPSTSGHPTRKCPSQVPSLLLWEATIFCLSLFPFLRYWAPRCLVYTTWSRKDKSPAPTGCSSKLDLTLAPSAFSKARPA